MLEASTNEGLNNRLFTLDKLGYFDRAEVLAGSTLLHAGGTHPIAATANDVNNLPFLTLSGGRNFVKSIFPTLDQQIADSVGSLDGVRATVESAVGTVRERAENIFETIQNAVDNLDLSGATGDIGSGGGTGTGSGVSSGGGMNLVTIAALAAGGYFIWKAVK